MSSGALDNDARPAVGTTPQGNVSAALELELRSVQKRYPGRRQAAIQDLSLMVPAGEVCVLVGPSGSGKTTAMRLINRMIQPSGGEILLGGRSVLSRDTTELRREIGYVIQQIGLFPHRTVRDNIATVPKLLGWSRERIEVRVEEMLKLISLDGAKLADRYPNQLSGGQRQRIGVARALAADPPLLLMDEPFGAIDPINRANLQDAFLALQAKVRKTVVFVTHDIDEAIKLGDKIVILREGGVLAQYASPAEILDHPADDFVADFVGADRALKRLGLATLAEVKLEKLNGHRPSAEIAATTSVRDALSAVLAGGGEPLTVIGEGGEALGLATLEAIGHVFRNGGGLLSAGWAAGMSLPIAAGAPVLPSFGSSHTLACQRANRLFCWAWFKSNWAGTLWPALRQHVVLVLIAVAIGFVISMALALLAYRYSRVEQPIVWFTSFLYTIPAVALFELLIGVPGLGLSLTSVEVALVAYSLLILYRNILTGLRSVSPDVRDAAIGMGMSRRQMLLRVELPLALPAIIAGLRIATVSTVALATIGVLVDNSGLGVPILAAINNSEGPFKTELIAAGGLAVLLAIAADALLVGVQRLLTPWARTRAA